MHQEIIEINTAIKSAAPVPVLDIDICKLTPDHADSYVHFFDVTPHDDNVDDSKCYCVCWSNDDYEGKDFSTREKRREYAIQYVRNGNIQGYLAYRGDDIVGWCNANTKSDCLKCCSWRTFMDAVPTEESESGVRIKSVFCFTVTPDMKRKGIATRLLGRVCQDAALDGFDFVVAYPCKEPVDENTNFRGAIELYKSNGFTIHYESDKLLVMRKRLK